MCGDVEAQWRRIEAAQEVSMPPEKLLAKMLNADIGVDVNPQALRMFIRARWPLVSKLAHRIKESA